jgi:hypothetical protein
MSSPAGGVDSAGRGRGYLSWVRTAAVLIVALFLVPGAAGRPARDRSAPQLFDLAVENGGAPFLGDTKTLVTVSPNGDGVRDAAVVHFTLREPATVTLDVTRTTTVPQKPVYTFTQHFKEGRHGIVWAPSPSLNPRTYLLLLTAADDSGNRRTYGAESANVTRYTTGPVVRLLGVDAGFTRPSYAPGQDAWLRIATDAPSLTLRLFRSGPEETPTYEDNVMRGVEVDAKPLTIQWRRYADAPQKIRYRIPELATGLYFAQLTAPDGRVGYAPFVVRPRVLGTNRVLVVIPTNTWQAYNFYDANGDGYGDTWYAGAPNRTVDLSRPYITRGVPPRFHRYDLGFLHWLAWTGRSVDYISDSDFAYIGDGAGLAAAYDLVIFEGHEEYVTDHEYDVVTQYRDAGGNLMFLSSNNFFWRVEKDDQLIRRTAQWRQLGRPEASLIGVQYVANDRGEKQGLYVVENAASASWLWEGTDLVDGSTLGAFVGGYGIEIDGTVAESPPGTIVLAEIKDLFGPGLTAQMTYYETPAGAKVFAAGVMDFGGSSTFWPVRHMLDNLWARLATP